MGAAVRGSVQKARRFSFMHMLIWHNIARRRAQSVLTIAITLLTVMSFVMVLGVYQVMQTGLTLSQERLGADALLLPRDVEADGQALLFSAVPENVYMPADVLQQAAAIEGVAAVTPQFYSQTLQGSCCDLGAETRIVGFDAETDFILQPFFSEKAYDELQEDEIILGGNFRNLMGKVFFVLANGFDVVGQLYPTGSGMDDTIFMDIDTVRRISAESEVLQALWTDKDPNEYISVVMVKLEPGVEPEDFAAAVARSDLDVQCVLTSSTVSHLQTQLGVITKVLLALWLAAMLIAALGLYGRFSSLAKSRKKEIGLLRAIGVRKSRVFGLMIGEACAMALIGGLAGSALALLCMGPVIDILRDAFSLSPSVWTWDLALGCAAAGVGLAGLLGLAAALLPAMKSASLDPQTAITQGEVN